jgi:hypothetical protein
LKMIISCRKRINSEVIVGSHGDLSTKSSGGNDPPIEMGGFLSILRGAQAVSDLHIAD